MNSGSSSSSPRWIGRVLLGVAGLSMVVAGIWGMNRRNLQNLEKADKDLTPLQRVMKIREEQARDDHETLRNVGRVPDTTLYNALVRLGHTQDLEARAASIKLTDSRAPLLREAAANVLGNFDDPISANKVVALTHDPDPSVRSEAIAALGYRVAKERVTILTKIFEDKTLGGRDRTLALRALYLASGSPLPGQPAISPESARRALAELADIAKSSTGAEGGWAANEAASLAPRDPKVLEAVRVRLPREKDPAQAANLVRLLTVSVDPWLKEHLSALDKDADPRVQIAIIQSLHSFCPENRFEMLERAAKDFKNPDVSAAAIRELTFMPGDRAKTILTGVQSTKGIPEAIKKQGEAALQNLAVTAFRDPCTPSKQ